MGGLHKLDPDLLLVGDTRVNLITEVSEGAAVWQNDTDFDAGAKNDTQVNGTGDNANVTLEKNTNNDDDIPYTTPSNYTLSDGAKLEIDSGVAKLKATSAGDNNWPFTTAGNYTYGSDIEVTGGVARLVGNPMFPYAWYHLNESSGTNVPDISGNSRNGTTQNMEDGDWVSGKLNNCLDFDGVNEYVDLGNICDFSRTDAFSVECWIKTSTVGTQILVARTNTDAVRRGWQLYIRAAGGNYRAALLLTNDISGTYVAVENDSVDVNDGSWHHIFATYDGTGVASGITVYVDNNSSNTTILDALGANSINTTVNCNIGARNGSATFSYNGNIDEVVIYDEEVPAIDVAARYNAGSGSEEMRLGYSIDNPNIVPNTGYVFTAAINTFTETATKPTGSGIKYQVSSDGGTTWKWWDGDSWETITGSQTDTWYYTNESNINTDINTNINTLAGSGTFKFRAFLHSDVGLIRPLLDNIYVAQSASYPTDDNLYIDTKDASQIAPAAILEWLTTTITETLPANTDIKLLFSVDGRVNWKTWSGSAWVAPASATTRTDATSITDAETNFADLPLGSGTLDVRAFIYSSDNLATPQLSNINVTSDTGYKTSGTWESNEYNSTYQSLDWGKAVFTTDIPTDTTLIVKARAGNTSGSLGDYSDALVNGEETNLTGKYFQFKVFFTTCICDTSTLFDVSVYYLIPTTVQYPGGA